MDSRFASGVVFGAMAYAMLAEFVRQLSANRLIADATDLCRDSWVT
ncbi:hypothetical protein ABT072_08430 [Streptomyces sp. NPDC002589]